MTSDELACCVDALFTDMGPTKSQFDSYCLKVEQLALRALVLPPRLVTSAGRRLGATSTKIVALVGYPFGAYPLKAKLSDAEETVKRGAGSLEFVLNPDALADANYEELESGLRCLAGILPGTEIGLIAEAGYLPADAWSAVCRAASENGISYVVCTAGFGGSSTVTPELIASLRANAPRGLRLKAWHGIGSLGGVEALREAGASLVGLPTLALERLAEEAKTRGVA